MLHLSLKMYLFVGFVLIRIGDCIKRFTKCTGTVPIGGYYCLRTRFFVEHKAVTLSEVFLFERRENSDYFSPLTLLEYSSKRIILTCSLPALHRREH